MALLYDRGNTTNILQWNCFPHVCLPLQISYRLEPNYLGLVNCRTVALFLHSITSPSRSLGLYLRKSAKVIQSSQNQTSISNRPTLLPSQILIMCQWYANYYNCKHTTYALAKYCASASLVQTPCKKKTIWNTIRVGEDCVDCFVPDRRSGSDVSGVVGQVKKTVIKRGRVR